MADLSFLESFFFWTSSSINFFCFLIAFSRVFFCESESKTLLCSETGTFSVSSLEEEPLPPSVELEEESPSESKSKSIDSPPLPLPPSTPFSIESSNSSNSLSEISRGSFEEEPLPSISESE